MNEIDSNEVRRWTRQVLWVRAVKGWTRAWTKHTLRDRFPGVPDPDLDEADIEQPDDDVLAFVKVKLAHFLADQGRDADDIAAYLERLDDDIARARENGATKAPRPRPRSGGNTHLRGIDGSMCGSLGQWHLEHTPRRFCDDPKKATCKRCRAGYGSWRMRLPRAETPVTAEPPPPPPQPLAANLFATWETVQ